MERCKKPKALLNFLRLRRGERDCTSELRRYKEGGLVDREKEEVVFPGKTGEVFVYHTPSTNGHSNGDGITEDKQRLEEQKWRYLWIANAANSGQRGVLTQQWVDYGIKHGLKPVSLDVLVKREIKFSQKGQLWKMARMGKS